VYVCTYVCMHMQVRICVCVGLHVCRMCMCVHVCACMYTHMQACNLVLRDAQVCISAYVYVCIHMQICIFMSVHELSFVHKLSYILTYIQIHIYIQTHTCSHKQVALMRRFVDAFQSGSSLYTHTYTHIHT
jgi:hypothetical protein